MKMQGYLLKTLIAIICTLLLLFVVLSFNTFHDIYNYLYTINTIYGYILVISIYGSLVPFFYMIVKLFKLIHAISIENPIKAIIIALIDHIKVSLYTIGAMFTLNYINIYIIADDTDAPGIILIWAFFISMFIFSGLIASLVAKTIAKVKD